MKLTLISNVLLFLAFYKWFGKWEIPFHMGFDPLEVVGGFTTLIDSRFEELIDKSPESSKSFNFPNENLRHPVVTPQYTRKLYWTCPIMESFDQCFTVVTSSECLPTSQFSYSFWKNAGNHTICFQKIKGHLECKTSFQSGNMCENVVMKIERSENNSTFFELDDVLINTQIVQNYAEKTSIAWRISKNESTADEMYSENYDECQDYNIHKMVLAISENNTDVIPLFPFGINSTKILHKNKCAPLFPANVFLCNCPNNPSCSVPIRYLDQNATYCASTTISIYHTRGFIYSAVAFSSSEILSDFQRYTVLFFDVFPTPPISNFDLQRGRFHCPSETSCIYEILYPFEFLNSLELSYQISILVFSLIVGVVVITKTNDK